MEGHSDPYFSCFRGPLGRVESELSIDSSLQSLGSGGESSLEGITDHLVGIATMSLNSMAENSLLLGEGTLHSSGVTFPAFGASLYIGEQEGDCAGGQLSHCCLSLAE